MKKTLIVVIAVLCCTFLFGSCKSEEGKEGPPSSENGADEDTGKNPNSPGSNSDNTTESDDKIQTGGPNAAEDTAANEENSSSGPAPAVTPGGQPGLPMTAGGVYNTIVNHSDNSYIKVSFVNSFNNPFSILLGEYDCVQITEAQFQNNIISIILVDVDAEDEDELFCGEGCLSPDEDDCYAECPVDNYRMHDGWFWDEIEINQPLSLRGSCVPLFQFQ